MSWIFCPLLAVSVHLLATVCGKALLCVNRVKTQVLSGPFGEPTRKHEQHKNVKPSTDLQFAQGDSFVAFTPR